MTSVRPVFSQKLLCREWELAKQKRQHDQELQVKLNSLEQREEQLARRALQFEADTCRIFSALSKAENILAEHNAAVYPQTPVEQPVATTSGVEESRCSVPFPFTSGTWLTLLELLIYKERAIFVNLTVGSSWRDGASEQH